MSLFIFVFLVIAFGGGIYLYGRRPASAGARAKNATRIGGKPLSSKLSKAERAKAIRKQKLRAAIEAEEKQWRSISLCCSENACESARAMAGKRFLLTEFPKIPLTACDAANCTCTFEHHKDRRSHDDRRDLQNSLTNDNNAKFKQVHARSGKDRRKNRNLDHELNTIKIKFD